jgi:hypothetical protein
MKCKLLISFVCSVMLLCSAPAARAQVSFGIRIGEPPPPRSYYVPARPGPDYEWVEGYWFPEAGRWHWHDGYWTRPPYGGAYWVQPYYLNGHYVGGYWDGRHGHVEHDHHWDHSHERDGYRYEEHEEHRR